MDEALIQEQERQLQKTGRYYRHVFWLCVPLLCMACYFYGARPLLLCGVALLTGNLCDRLVALLRHRVYTNKDLSNESFSLIIALLMPATVDIYVLVVAVLAIFTDVFSGKKAPDKDTDSPAVTQPADGEPDGTGDADNTAKDPEGDQKGGQSGNGDGNTDKSTVTTTKPATPNVITTDATPYQSGGVYIVGNAGYEMYNYVGSLAEKYQSTVNAVADSLSGVSNVYAMAIPLSSSITLPDSLLSDIPGSDQAQAEKDILAGMGQNIKTVPLHDALNAHRTEYIYFRTDHHWTALGAYYAYVQFCNVKGITPHDLSDYEVSQYTGFLGSFYNDGGKPQAMADDPDTVNAYHPVSSTAASMAARLPHSTAQPGSRTGAAVMA